MNVDRVAIPPGRGVTCVADAAILVTGGVSASNMKDAAISPASAVGEMTPPQQPALFTLEEGVVGTEHGAYRVAASHMLVHMRMNSAAVRNWRLLPCA